jgi:predicted acyltransferase
MKNNRLISLDILRGITILVMVIVNNPGNWNAVYPALLHAEWHGCKLADFVFPFFIFIVGMSIPLANPTKEKSIKNSTKFLVRGLRIICLGLFLNYFNTISVFSLEGVPLILFRAVLTLVVGFTLMGNYNYEIKKYSSFILFGCFMFLAFDTDQFQEVRIMGVLQRIGIVYFFASLAYTFTSTRVQLVIALVILLGYWAIMSWIPVPGFGNPNFEMGTNLAAWVDQIILKNHVYVGTKPWDPEGVLSTLPAIAQGIIGCLIGYLVLNTLNKIEMMKKLNLIGVVLILFSSIIAIYFPINKSIWTSSFVLYTSGIAILLFTLLFYIVDFKKIVNKSNLLIMWGVNPMIVFFLSGIIPRTLAMIQIEKPNTMGEKISIQKYGYIYAIEPYFTNPMTASFVHALLFILLFQILLYFLYRNNTIIKV